MIFDMQDKQNLTFYKEGFQQTQDISVEKV